MYLKMFYFEVFLLLVTLPPLLCYSPALDGTAENNSLNFLRLGRATWLNTSYNIESIPSHLHLQNHSDPVIVRVGVALRKILEVEEFEQLVKVSVWVREYWLDERLSWNPDEFGGIQSIRLPHEAVWTPDLMLYTNGEGDFEPLKHLNVFVDHEGHMTYLYPSLYSVSCHMDIQFFPFDEQKCYIELGSWSYDAAVLDLQLKEGIPADTGNYDTNTAWQLVSFTATEVLKSFGSDDIVFYKAVSFEIVIRRYWTIHFFYVLIPIFLIQLLAAMQFLLPCDSIEKIILGVNIYLSMIIYLLMVSELLPSTKVIPLIVEYIISTLLLVGVAQAITIVVLKLHHMGKHDNHYMLPHWARVIFLHRVARVIGMSKYVNNDIEHLAKMTQEPRDPITKFATTSSSSSSSYTSAAAPRRHSEKRNTGVLVGLNNLVRRMSKSSNSQPAQQDRNISNSCNRNGPNIGEEEEDMDERLCHVVSGSGLCKHTKTCEECHTHCEAAYAGIRHKHKLNAYQLQRKLDTGAYSYTVCCCACMREALAHKPWAHDLVPLKQSWQRTYTNNNTMKKADAMQGYSNANDNNTNDFNLNDNNNLNEGAPVEPKWSRVRATVLKGEDDNEVIEFVSARQRRLEEVKRQEEARQRGNTGRWSIESAQYNKGDVKEYLLLKIYRKLAQHKQRLNDEDIEAEIRCEWQQLAMVLNRLMFIIYIIGTLGIFIRMSVLLGLKKSSLIAIARENRG